MSHEANATVVNPLPAPLRGSASVPGDKSISHRSVMLGSIAKGTTEIHNFLEGADCLSTIGCFRRMGIDIENKNGVVTVHGKGMHGLAATADPLDCGNSGTTTRLISGILAPQNFDVTLTGDESIQKRPMKRIIEPLSMMGADIKSVRGNDCAPLRICGKPLAGIHYTSSVASAQVKSSLLLAGLYADGLTSVTEPQVSRNHTELMLSAMGADLTVDNLDITVKPTNDLTAVNVDVPGDISSAAFFLVLGAIMPNSQITVTNVGINPTRTGIIDVLKDMGADITLENVHTSAGETVADITVRSSSLKGTTVGGDIIPRLIDELPIIAVAAVFADGQTVIKDAQELKVKETNRIRAVVDEFNKCGIDITETDDGMIINGGKSIHGADFKTYGDHRMAMSLTVLAQLADGESTLDDSDCACVSYPTFFDDFYKLGK